MYMFSDNKMGATHGRYYGFEKQHNLNKLIVNYKEKYSRN